MARSIDVAAWGEPLETDLRRLADQNDALVARTEIWSRVNSGSLEVAGLGRMADLLARAFSNLPGDIRIEPLAPTERMGADGVLFEIAHAAALRLRVRPDAEVQIALTGHYDTVFPSDHPFQSPVRFDESKLRGPGVADMKGGLSVMLAALEAFEALPGSKRLGYEVLLSPDEEIGSPASGPLLAELGRRAHFGMTYEPARADGALAGARKGSGNFSIVFNGRGAHVGRAFETGRNAVVAAAETAQAIAALNGRRDGVTFNIGAIDGGGAVNIVPERAVLRFNVRAPDASDAAWALAEIEFIVRAADGRNEVSAHLHGAFTRPPKPLTPAQEIVAGWTRRAGAALGQDLSFFSSGGVCEGNNLAAAGCPNIDTLGPCGGGLHTDQEFALIDSFAERAQLSLLLLAGIDRGLFDVRSLRT